jgi:hypothetical protein
LPVTPKFAFHRGSLRSKIEDPACDKTAKDGHVRDNYGDVVLHMVDTVVDGICPVGFEQAVQSVAIREIYFRGSDCCDTIAVLSTCHDMRIRVLTLSWK